MSRLPLARACRPQRFAEVLGQAAPIRALGSAARERNLASAYIFSGTRGIGKTTIARIFAKTLNCAEGPAEDCCDACEACIEIREGKSLDVLEMDAATHTGIDDIRELREGAQYPPSKERHRVFILDEAHQLSASAWNGLLKILEEPPPWCVFLFCTTEPHKIPATIESRSLHFAFRSPTPAQLRDHLATVAAGAEIEVEPAALDLLVKAADGSVRDGLSALDQARAVGGTPLSADAVREALGLVPGEAVEHYLRAVTGGDAAGALAGVADLEDEGQDLRAFTAEVLESVRRLALLCQVGPEATPAPAWEKELAARLDPRPLLWAGRILDETETRLRQGGPARTLLDLATLRLVQVMDLEPLESLVARLDSGGGGGRPLASGARSGAPTRERSGGTSNSPGSPPPSRQTAAMGTLLEQLVAEIRTLRPSLAPSLAKAAAAEVDPAGRLVLALAPETANLWQARLSSEAARASLAEATEKITGNRPTEVVVETRGSGSAPPARTSRRELMDRARKDPVVKALFDRFGAVVIDTQPLEGGKET